MNLGYYPSFLTKLYVVMQQYDTERKALQETLYAAADRLEKYKDSKAYEEEINKALKQYDDALKPLQESTYHYINYIGKQLVEKVNQMKMDPVTDEQLNILKLAKMRDTLTEDELDSLAESVKENPTALGVVADLARKNGVLKDYKKLNKTVTRSDAMEIIKSITTYAADYVKSDISRAAQLAISYEINHYGGVDPMKNALTQRDLSRTNADFENESSFYGTVCHMEQSDCESFKNAVGDN